MKKNKNASSNKRHTNKRNNRRNPQKKQSETNSVKTSNEFRSFETSSMLSRFYFGSNIFNFYTPEMLKDLGMALKNPEGDFVNEKNNMIGYTQVVPTIPEEEFKT